jgi:gas vesicle protein
MENTLTQVSSEQLVILQAELKQLSKNLMETYNTVSQGLKNLGEDWKDDKYDEFEQEFKSSKEEIREIAEKYEEWANTYLPLRIELVQEAEGVSMARR